MKEKFLWGTASAAAQIEGGWNEGGRTESCWDFYPTIDGLIYGHQDCKIACDSFHKFEEDLKLLVNLGVNSYRFSISWNRILPYDNDEINQEGIDYYNNIINKLLEKGITPLITMFHWDMPMYLYNKGGWLNRDIAKYFEKYAKVILDNFSDRVKTYITINEPPCCIWNLGGTEQREHSIKEVLLMSHNLLLCNGLMTREVHKHGCKCSVAICGDFWAPASNSSADYNAAYNAFLDIKEGNIGSLTFFLDPIINGKYPEKYFLVHKKDDIPEITEEDMKIINCGADFIAYNVYTCRLAKYNNDNFYEEVPYPRGTPQTLMNWIVNPDCTYYPAKFFYKKYNLPVMITENGCSVTDLIEKNKKIHDGSRSYYIKKHIERLLDAKKEGVPVLGYFYWSLLDNFEWKLGYSQRFGISYVDYSDCKRYKKDSFFTYKSIIKKHKNI